MSDLPALLVFRKGKLLGHIDGYYTIEEKEAVISKLTSIIEDNK